MCSVREVETRYVTKVPYDRSFSDAEISPPGPYNGSTRNTSVLELRLYACFRAEGSFTRT